MASLPCPLSGMLFAILPVILMSVAPACSMTTQVLDNRNTQIRFKLSLQHVDSGGNFTKFERLKRATKRGRNRWQRLSEMVSAAAARDSSQVKSPIYPGNGEFLMKLSIGTPAEPYSAIMDTGSDLIWTQCNPCQQCFDQTAPIFDPEKSSSFSKLSCSTDLCKALPLSSCDVDDDCEYLYGYGDYSSTQGFMATETFTFDKVSIPNIGFGCGVDNEGNGFSQGAGLVGLGRGPLSLVSQLGEPEFSYCLTSSIEDTKTSTLVMGSDLTGVNSTAGRGDAMKTTITTHLIQNPSQPSFYYLSLLGITVGDTDLAINKSTFALNEDGSGGLIIDSGTTITYLEESAFDLVKKEFISQVKLPVDDSAGTSTGLDLCFTLPSDTKVAEVPKLVFHFDGADLDLPAENYMVADSDMGLMCLAMGSSSGLSVFGNVQQHNMLVVHDLAKETLSFIPTQCHLL